MILLYRALNFKKNIILKKKHLIIIISFLFMACVKSKTNKFENLKKQTLFKTEERISKTNLLQDKSVKNVIAIKVPENQDEKFKYSEIIKEINLVPLETMPESLVASIDELIIENNLIYILDKTQKKIICFHKNGKFNFSINSIGRGPKEYISISDLFVNNEKMFLLDSDQNKILIFSIKGEFIKEIIFDFPYPFQSLGVINDNYLIDFNNKVIPDLIPELEYDLLTLNDLGQVKSRNLKYNNDILRILPYTQSTSFFNYNATLSYISLLKNRVYRISNGFVEEKYFLDFGDNKVPQIELELFKNIDINTNKGRKEAQRKLRKIVGNYSLGPFNFLESESHISITFLKNDKFVKGIYCKETKEIKLDYQAIFDHELGLILDYALPISVDESDFYGVVYPNDILKVNRGFQNSALESLYKRFPKYKGFTKMFEENENSNPYISVIKFNEF